MRKKLRIAIGILSLVAVAFTVTSFIFRLTEVKTSGELASGAEYSILRNAVISITSKEDFQDRFIRDRLLALYEGSTRLLAAQVLDENGLSVWKIPSESKYFALPNQKGARAGFTSPQWSTVVFTTALPGNLKLAALYASVFASEVSTAAKLPAIVIGIWFLLIFAVSFFITKDKTEGLLPEPIDTKAFSENQGNELVREMVQTQEGLIEIPPLGTHEKVEQEAPVELKNETASQVQPSPSESKNLGLEEQAGSEAPTMQRVEPHEGTFGQLPSKAEEHPQDTPSSDAVSSASIFTGQNPDAELSPELLAAYGLTEDILKEMPEKLQNAPVTGRTTSSAAGHEKTQIIGSLKDETARTNTNTIQPQSQKFAPLQGSIQNSLPKSANFEESLQKFEEEVILWTKRQQQAAPVQTASKDSVGANAVPPTSADVSAPQTAPAEKALQYPPSQPESNRAGHSVSGSEPYRGSQPPSTNTGNSEPLTQDQRVAQSQELPEGLDQEMEETLEELETKDEKLFNEDESEVTSAKKPETIIPSTADEKRDIASLQMPLSISEPNLENLLDDELTHGMERDTSLMLIHCELSGPHDPAANALYATIRDYFVAKELMFELYKGGFAVVMPGMDLGSSLKMSEDLADVLAATMNLYKDMEGEPPVFIGISSAGGRAIDAQKLYREASTALHKAYSGSPWHILAFRPKIAQRM